MNVKDAIVNRRAYRSLKKTEVTEEMISELAQAAALAPSCANYQPWRYVFVYEEKMLQALWEGLSQGNRWAQTAPLLIAVFSQKDLDCVIKDRLYYQFDTGLATGFLILRAMEMGLVAHPMAGFKPEKVHERLGIPKEMEIITVIAVGPKDDELNPHLSQNQIVSESNRPERIPSSEFVFHNRYEAPEDSSEE